MSAFTSPRARRAAGLTGLLGTAVLLVVGRAATAPPAPPVVVAGTAPTPPHAPSSAASPSAGPPPPAAPSGGPTSPAPPATVLGRPEDATYGIVQVQLTLSGGRITDVQAARLPSGGRSSAISSYAAPLLRKEVLDAQSAHIDTVSGASYTSEAYARSVQSALDSAPR